MKPCRLLYFVKYPEPGKVKTRLARAIGHKAAAALYRKLAEKNFRVLQSLGNPQFEICVMFDPPEAEPQIKAWLKGKNCSYFAQRGGDLGERLANAFQSAFEVGAGKAMAIGSDTLDFKTQYVEKASELLESKEIVIGPAKDGGYYLVGLSLPEFFVFKDIPWSTSEVLATTLKRVQERRLIWKLLPELEDLDELEDLNPSLQLE